MKRTLSLDLLRGLTIFGMILSSMIPFGDVLPSWMYHGQEPPPLHTFNSLLAGITWVDLVLPIFIFCMGAAIPLALNKKIENGISTPKIMLGIGKRFIMLVAFAIYIAHILPYAIGEGKWNFTLWGNDTKGLDLQLLTLLGFALLFPMYMVFKNKRHILPARIIGWGGAFILLVFFHFAYGQSFSLFRNNIIILLLGNVYLVGAISWYFTRKNWTTRFALFALWGAIQLCCKSTGFDTVLNDFKPLSWMFIFRMTHYMLLLIPATIVGDMLLNRQKSGYDFKKVITNSFPVHLFFISLAGIAIWLTVSMYMRWLAAAYIITPLILVGLYLVVLKKLPEYRQMFLLAAYLIVMGLILEPVEGGIKKDYATASYMVLTAGIALCLLMFFDYICRFVPTSDFVKLFSNAGSNPLMAYMGGSWFMMPFLKASLLIGLYNILYPEGYPWIGVLRAVGLVVIIMFLVGALTKRKIIWRA